MKNLLASILIGILLPLAAFSAWQDMNISNNTLYAIKFMQGNQIGYATEVGRIFRTYDYGTTWGAVVIDSNDMDINFKDIAVLDTNKLIVVGTNGKLYRTTNATTWNELTSGASSSLNAIDFFDSNNGVIVTSDGGFLYSSDAGASWSRSPYTNVNKLNDVDMLSSTEAIAVGNSGNIFKSVNAGQAWSKISSGISENITSVHFPTATTGYICTVNGNVYKTTDAGTTWSLKTQYTNSSLWSIYFIDDSNGMVVGDNGTVLKTSNGGQSWQVSNTSDNNHYFSVFYSAPDYAYIVGTQGSSFKTDNNAAGSYMELTLLSPNSDTLYTSDKNAEIRWTGLNMDNQNIDILYSSNNGSVWNYIETVSFSDSTYLWNVPDIASSQMKIKLRHSLNYGLEDISDVPFEVTTNKINITSPALNNKYQAGKTIAITWNSYDIDYLDLEYTTDGVSWTAIADDVPASASVYFWTAPQNASSNYQVRATDVDNNINKSTTPVFTVAQLSLDNPQDGSIINEEFTYPVTWTSTLVNSVKFEYSMDNVNWYNIDTKPASLGSFNWTTPDQSGTAWLRISDANYPLVQDVHSFTFAKSEEISITNPSTASTFLMGQAVQITWSSIITENVKIEVSYDNGSNWETLVNMISADVGTYTWIPSQLSSEGLVKITSTDNSSIFDISNYPVKIGDITILAPGPGQEILAESQTSINWSSTNIDNVKIDYSLNNWSNATEIVNSVSAQTGSYAWNVPDVNSNQARVRIAAANNPDVAKEVVFNIKQTLNLSLVAPNGGELLKSGSLFPITWNYKNISSIDIEYSTDGGTIWNSIATMVDATTSPYYWTVPDINEQECLIRIKQSTDPDVVYAVSDESFAISNARLELLSPNGGELWYINDSTQIRWDSKGINNLGLAYRIHPDSAWVEISDSEPAFPSMYFGWNIPIIPSNSVSIKIFDAENPAIYDISDADFTVAGIRLTSLNSAEKLIFREQTKVTWEAVEVTDIQLSYSTDMGANWQIIENSYSAEKESYTWDAPYPPSADCLFRIRDNNNSSLVDTSDIPFSINGLLLENNMEGKELLVGTDYHINWLSQDVNNVKIEYSTDRGNNWLTVISYTESDGSYKWLVPNTPAEHCKLKVTDLDNNTVYDQNKGYYKITGTGINLITPNGKESWALGTVDTIKWSSVNVDFINIDISYDNGVTPVRIASSIPADTNFNQFIWTVSGSPSTECQITISDADNPNLKAVSESNFTITGGVFPPPQDWEYTSHTGKNSVIILPTSVNPEVSGRPLSDGDALGVFYTDLSGNEKSAGYGIWDGNNLSVTVWGDNDQTTAKDGFTSEETYKLRLWDAQEGRETRAKVTYSSGNSFFSDNGISIIGSMNAHEKLRIILEPGVWSMISSYLLPANTKIDTIMKDVTSLELMKDELGDLYYPEQEINTINNWDVTDGYQIYVNDKDTLEIEGTLVNATNYPIAMDASKWYIISYLFDSPVPITTAMSRIDSSIVLVKNDDGEIWYPSYGINQIGNMVPGEGYKIVLNENNTLIYNNGGLLPKIKSDEEIIAEQYEVAHTQTGSNCNLILTLVDFSYKDEIAVKNANGLVVGSGINNNGKIALTVWGDNLNTEIIDGMQKGEALNLYLWSVEEKKEYKLSLSEYKDVLAGNTSSGDILYKTDAIYEAKVSKSNITGIEEINTDVAIFPNPASEYISVKSNVYDTYTITDIMGKTMQRGNLKQTIINISSLASGTYTIQLSSATKTKNFNFTVVR